MKYAGLCQQLFLREMLRIQRHRAHHTLGHIRVVLPATSNTPPAASSFLPIFANNDMLVAQFRREARKLWTTKPVMKDRRMAGYSENITPSVVLAGVPIRNAKQGSWSSPASGFRKNWLAEQEPGSQCPGECPASQCLFRGWLLVATFGHQKQEKPTWQNTQRYAAMSAYFPTGLPAYAEPALHLVFRFGAEHGKALAPPQAQVIRTIR